ncbi:hypothetical protein [Zunongwangia sp. H14]|uniref:hypothetical protein n=1 Tax=Zunongwangia sp. H14 TaxID=3240792 RepID=UPI0035624732
MNIALILLSAFTATAVMTIFTYICAAVRHSQFKPPELLNQLSSSASTIPLKVGKNNVLGWIIHFAIGLAFVLIFEWIWNNFSVETSILSGAVFGFFAGIVGIGGWKTMFAINTDPPNIELRSFFIQLLVAHILFGITAAVVFMMA